MKPRGLRSAWGWMSIASALTIASTLVYGVLKGSPIIVVVMLALVPGQAYRVTEYFIKGRRP